MHSVVPKKELFAIVDGVRHFSADFHGHPVTNVRDNRPLLRFTKSLQTNTVVITWQESLSQLDTSIEYLEGKKNTIADAVSRIYNNIKIRPTRDSFSPPDYRHSSTAQLHVRTNHHTFSTPYLYIPLPIITSYATMPCQINKRITAGNRTRRYDEDDPQD